MQYKTTVFKKSFTIFCEKGVCMNKEIKEFSTSLLVPSEFVACADIFDEIFSRNAIQDPFVKSQCVKMMGSSSKLEMMLKTMRDKHFTEDLAKKDEARNVALRSLYNCLEGSSGIEVRPDTKTGAEYLLSLIKGNRADKSGATKKSGAILSILEKFKDPIAQNFVTQLGIADIVKSLADAQDAYKESYQTKIAAEAKEAPSSDARSQCNEVGYHITKILHYVDAQAETDSEFSGIISELNEAITDIMTKAHSRKTRSNSASSSPKPEPAPKPAADNSTPG